MSKCFIVVGIGQAPWESDSPKDVHGVEGPVEKDECEEEVDLAQSFVHHATKHFRVPMVDRPKNAHSGTGEQNVVKMGHNKVSVVDKNIDGRGRHENSRQSADDKHRDK